MTNAIRYYKLVILLIIIFTILISLPHSNARDNARVYTTHYFYTQTSDRQHALNGFSKLSYNVSAQNNPSRANILNWTNSGGSSYNYYNYAFYISTHGPNDELAETGVTYFLDDNGVRIEPGDIIGAWHFVYIDACNSKRNNRFPDSLNITGRSQRAYIGWATSVGIAEANQFNNYFWETYILNHPIHTATLKASADVPGANSTPSRFVGDSSWYGVGG